MFNARQSSANKADLDRKAASLRGQSELPTNAAQPYSGNNLLRDRGIPEGIGTETDETAYLQDSDECQCGLQNHYACLDCFGVCCSNCVQLIHDDKCVATSMIHKIRHIIKQTQQRVATMIHELKETEDNFDHLCEFFKHLFEQWNYQMTQSIGMDAAELQSQILTINTQAKRLQKCSKEDAKTIIPQIQQLSQLEAKVEQFRQQSDRDINAQLYQQVKQQYDDSDRKILRPNAVHMIQQPALNWLYDFQQKCVIGEHISKLIEENVELRQQVYELRQKCTQMTKICTQLNDYGAPTIVLPLIMFCMVPFCSNGVYKDQFSTVILHYYDQMSSAEQAPSTVVFDLSTTTILPSETAIFGTNQLQTVQETGPVSKAAPTNNNYKNAVLLSRIDSHKADKQLQKNPNSTKSRLQTNCSNKQVIIDGQTDWSQFALISGNGDYTEDDFELTREVKMDQIDRYYEFKLVDELSIQIGEYIYLCRFKQYLVRYRVN